MTKHAAHKVMDAMVQVTVPAVGQTWIDRSGNNVELVRDLEAGIPANQAEGYEFPLVGSNGQTYSRTGRVFGDGFQAKGDLMQLVESGPRPVSADDAHAKAAIRTLERMGYTWSGGLEWRPPFGKAVMWSETAEAKARAKGDV